MAEGQEVTQTYQVGEQIVEVASSQVNVVHMLHYQVLADQSRTVQKDVFDCVRLILFQLRQDPMSVVHMTHSPHRTQTPLMLSVLSRVQLLQLVQSCRNVINGGLVRLTGQSSAQLPSSESYK
jgi:hypothetical protein